MKTFNLIPFPTAEVLPKIEIVGTIDRQDSRLFLLFKLRGDLKQIVLSQPDENPSRQDNLWQTTCFEFFLAMPNHSGYWEFNLAPTGHWNCYRFENYRQGMVPEASFTHLPFSVQQSEQSFKLDLSLDLTSFIALSQPIEIAIATVIQTVNQDLSYWALTHRGKEADFHRRDSFTIIF